MAYVENVTQLSDSVASYSVDIDPEELYLVVEAPEADEVQTCEE